MMPEDHGLTKSSHYSTFFYIILELQRTMLSTKGSSLLSLVMVWLRLHLPCFLVFCHNNPVFGSLLNCTKQYLQFSSYHLMTNQSPHSSAERSLNQEACRMEFRRLQHTSLHTDPTLSPRKKCREKPKPHFIIVFKR